jgi:hypothetical protein
MGITESGYQEHEERNTTHLKPEKPRLRFLEGSGGTPAEPADVLTDDPSTGGAVPAFGVGSTATSSAPGDGGGAGSHLPEVVCSSSPSSSSEDESTSSDGGDRPCCSRNQ